MKDTTRHLELARAGSRDAFCVIVREYQARVRSFLARYVHNHTLVDDLAQETFLKAYVGLASYDPGKPLTLWLLGIARNQALMHFREEQNRRTREARASTSTLAGWWAAQIASDGDRERNHERELQALET